MHQESLTLLCTRTAAYFAIYPETMCLLSGKNFRFRYHLVMPKGKSVCRDICALHQLQVDDLETSNGPVRLLEPRVMKQARIYITLDL